MNQRLLYVIQRLTNALQLYQATKNRYEPPEAELFEITRTAKEVRAMKGLVREAGREVNAAILTDSKSSVDTSHNPISTRYNYLSAIVAFLKRQVDKISTSTRSSATSISLICSQNRRARQHSSNSARCCFNRSHGSTQESKERGTESSPRYLNPNPSNDHQPSNYI